MNISSLNSNHGVKCATDAPLQEAGVQNKHKTVAESIFQNIRDLSIVRPESNFKIISLDVLKLTLTYLDLRSLSNFSQTDRYNQKLVYSCAGLLYPKVLELMLMTMQEIQGYLQEHEIFIRPYIVETLALTNRKLAFEIANEISNKYRKSQSFAKMRTPINLKIAKVNPKEMQLDGYGDQGFAELALLLVTIDVEAAVEIAEQISRQGFQARTFYGMGKALKGANPEKSNSLFQSAVDAARKIEDTYETIDTLMQIEEELSPEKAREVFQIAIEDSLKKDNPFGIPVLHKIANKMVLIDSQWAEELVQRCMDKKVEGLEKCDKAYTQMKMAASLNLENFPRAKKIFHQAVVKLQDANYGVEGHPSYLIADALALNNPEMAIPFAEKTEYPVHKASVFRRIGISLGKINPEKAIKSLLIAEESANQMNRDSRRAWTLYEIAYAFLEIDRRKANEIFQCAFDTCLKAGKLYSSVFTPFFFIIGKLAAINPEMCQEVVFTAVKYSEESLDKKTHMEFLIDIADIIVSINPGFALKTALKALDDKESSSRLLVKVVKLLSKVLAQIPSR